jgi:hypothetical protein
MTTPPAGAEQRTYVESSSGGELTVELDADGYLQRCQLEPEVNAGWTAAQLSQRIMALYQLAFMRACCDKRAQANELGADQPPDAVWVSEADIAAYRARHLTF